MSWVAAAVVGSTVVSGMMGNSAAKDAANAQALAGDAALNFQQRQINQQRKDAKPWRDAGVKAIAGLQDADFKRDFTMSDFQADPGHAFRMQEANKALERSAAARGGLFSGGTLKALQDLNQEAASKEYKNS